jgi:mannose-1-phosphate guanylyltransferase
MRFGVILAGGGGTRLWPASRRRRPKQYLSLSDLGPTGDTLLGATARRFGNDLSIVVVTAADQVDEVQRALPGRGETIAEPSGRNTAAAIGLAAVHLAARDPGATLGIVPADQHIADEPGFRRAANRAFQLAEERDAIVTLGIKPTHAETGFGYLEPGDDLGDGARICRRFVEKPDRARAEEYVRAGFLWNAGMFFVSARRVLAEIARHLPRTAAGLAQIAEALGKGPAEATRVAAEVYPGFESVSIDHGVMEKAEGILLVEGDFGWNDIGSWSAVGEIGTPDQAGNVSRTTSIFVESKGNVVVGDPGTVIALVGVEDLVVVQAGDAVLVMPKARAQDVREVVRELERRGMKDRL